MRHLHSTKLQHLRKSTMKQIASAPNYAARVVGPFIGNDEVGSSILPRGTSNHYIFCKTQTNRSPHYATRGGTKHDFHTPKDTAMREGTGR